MSSGKLVAADRVRNVDENIWVEFGELARVNKAIHLGQGFPDFAAPNHITQALSDATLSQDNVLNNQYTRDYGHVRLVNVLAKMYSNLTGHNVDPQTDILVTIGAYESLYCAILGNVNPGDEVIIIEPFFDAYDLMVLMAGGVPVYMPLRPTKTGQKMTSGDWIMDEKELQSKFNSKTKAIIVNTPHNPLGKVFKRHELEQIANLAKKWDVLVIMDEVYEWVVFKGNEHVRMATLPDMWNRTVTIGSGGKSFSVTGWKLGWTYGPKHLIAHSRALHQNCIYTCTTPVQEALAVGFEIEIGRLGTDECYFEQLKLMLEGMRDTMVDCLERSGIIPVIPEAGYFTMADYSSIGENIVFDDGSKKPKDHKFCRWLCTEKKLAVIPPSAFYSEPHKHLAENYIRLCHFKKEDTLKAAGKILLDLKNCNCV